MDVMMHTIEGIRLAVFGRQNTTPGDRVG